MYINFIATFTDIRFTPGLPHQPIEFGDPNQSHSETQSIQFEDQPDQFHPSFTDIRFTPGLPHQSIEFEDPNQYYSERQSIQFEDQDDQFEGFDAVEPQNQQEEEEEEQQQQQRQQEQLANGCFIQQCDQTITGRQLRYSR